jgi:hypothetical protein
LDRRIHLLLAVHPLRRRRQPRKRRRRRPHPRRTRKLRPHQRRRRNQVMETDIKSLNTPNPFSQVFPDCTFPPSPFLWGADNRLISSDLTSDQIKKLKGTGKNGMLTKGDVLKAMGQIKSAYGSAEKMYNDPLGPSGKRASEVRSFPLFFLSSLFVPPSPFLLLLFAYSPSILMSRK